MRISASKNDRGWRPEVQACIFSATLNGEQMSRVVTVDEEAGTIERHAMDAVGNLILNEERDAFVLETFHGSVCVVVRDDVKGAPRIWGEEKIRQWRAEDKGNA